MPFIEMSTTYDKMDLLNQHQLSGKKGPGQAVNNMTALAPVVGGEPIYTAQFCPSDPDSFSGKTVDGKNLGMWGYHNNRRTGGRCYDVSLGPLGFPAATPDCPNGSTASWCRAASNWWNSASQPIYSVKATPGVFNWSYEFECEFKDITSKSILSYAAPKSIIIIWYLEVITNSQIIRIEKDKLPNGLSLDDLD